MIYKKQSFSDSYFKLMFEEAVKRDLNCKFFAKEILNFKKSISDSSMPNLISADATTSPPSEIVHPGTGQTPK